MRCHCLPLSSILGLLALVSLVSLTGSVAAAAPAVTPTATVDPVVDPFYLALYQQGTQSLDDHREKKAAQELRLACFGMLDVPALLGECLTRLGLAEAGADDKDGFADTFRRLSTVEERFGGYRQAALPVEVKSAFEQWLIRLIPEQQLATVPAFAPLAFERQVAKLRRLPARERRAALDERLRAEPDSSRWQTLSAELTAEQGDREAALREIEAILMRDPALVDARCLRGRLLANGATCARAVADLAACPTVGADLDLATAALGCRLSLGQTREAAALLTEMPPEIRADRGITRLARQLEAQPAVSKPPSPATTSLPPASPPVSKPEPPPAKPGKPAAKSDAPAESAKPAPVEPPPSDPAAPAPSAAPPVMPSAEEAGATSEALRRQLAEIRQSLSGTQHAGELAEPLRQARQLADANPRSAEAQILVAEIAYRASRFKDAAEYFRRGGDPGESRPVLLFYMAVSFYEDGDRAAAAAALQRCLPKLERTPFVEAYREKILGPEKSH